LFHDPQKASHLSERTLSTGAECRIVVSASPPQRYGFAQPLALDQPPIPTEKRGMAVSLRRRLHPRGLGTGLLVGNQGRTAGDRALKQLLSTLPDEIVD
jgi:hypothetical protein